MLLVYENKSKTATTETWSNFKDLVATVRSDPTNFARLLFT